MSFWKIKADQAQEIYSQLQIIANQVQDTPTNLTEQKSEETPFDMTLSRDDMMVAISNKSIIRNEIFFVDHSKEKPVRLAHFKDLQILFRGLVYLDKKDGQFDGSVKSANEFLTVPTVGSPIAFAAELKKPAVFSVDVEAKKGKWGGTAWIVDKIKQDDGRYEYYALSNAHVMDQLASEEIMIDLWSYDRSRKYRVDLVGVDHTFDVAVVKFIADENLPTIQFAKDPISESQPVVALGNQNGRSISYAEGQINEPEAYFKTKTFPTIQHDTNSSSGNSGSPILNEKAEAVGMHFAGDKRSRGVTGFAIPIDLVKQSYQAIRQSGEHIHGTTSDSSYTILTADQMKWMSIQVSESGYYLQSVTPGSEEWNAGLRAGDVVLTVNGKPAENKYWQRLEFELTQLEVGTEVTLEILSLSNPSKVKTLKYIQGARSSSGLETYKTSLGFTVNSLRESKSTELSKVAPEAQNGVQIAVSRQSSSLMIGANCTIFELNGKSFDGVDGFRKLLDKELKKEKPIIATVMAGRSSRMMPYSTYKVPITNMSAKRIISKLGDSRIRMISLTEDEKVALGVKDALGDAYLIVGTGKSVVNHSNQEPMNFGDVLIAYNGKGFDQETEDEENKGDKTTFNLIKYLEDLEQSEMSELEVWRNGKLKTLQTRVRGKDNTLTESSSSPFSYKSSEVSWESHPHLGLNEGEEGVYISLYEGQKSHPYQFESGMIVQSVNGIKVTSAKQLEKQIDKIKKQQKVLYFEVIGNAHWFECNMKKLIFSKEHFKP